MPRGSRLKFLGDRGVYHVLSQTVRQAPLFDSDERKEWIYKHVVWLSGIFYVDVHAIAVMSNHYHLVLRVEKPTPNERDIQSRFEDYQKARRHQRRWGSWLLDEWVRKLTDLSWFMKLLNEDIARYINRLDGKRGHVMGDRYRSILIEDGIGVLQCMAYAELNCVRAGLCDSPLEYRFCSAGRYHQGGPEHAGVTFPNLKTFSFLGSPVAQQKAFALFVDHLARTYKGQDAVFPKEYGGIEKLVDDTSIEDFADLVFHRTAWADHSLILGGEAFCRDMIDQFGLQPLSYGDPTPFRLTGALCNAHRRAGRHSS